MCVGTAKYVNSTMSLVSGSFVPTLCGRGWESYEQYLPGSRLKGAIIQLSRTFELYENIELVL